MTDLPIRLAAFDHLRRLIEREGDVLSAAVLKRGFEYRGDTVLFRSQQGIFKPRQMDLPLSILSSVGGPYEDAFTSDGLLRYRYRGTDPAHRDNWGLREVMRRELPLVYFHGVMKAKYLAVFPVYIVGDSPEQLAFSVAVDDNVLGFDAAGLGTAEAVAEASLQQEREVKRRYLTTLVRKRVHQRTFRERVLSAYQEQCALCRLRHARLLDAAHIRSDSEEGEPQVTNGIALCKIHHAAFDQFFLGITPDYRVKVRLDVLKERDGPMLRHGLQEMDGVKLWLPLKEGLRPDRALLEERYARFLEQ